MNSSAERFENTAHDIVVVGGSRGSLQPMQQLLGAMPAGMGAALFVVQHRAAGSFSLEGVLAKSSVLPVLPAVDAQAIERSTVYVAPPDRHLFLKDGRMRVLFGPRENLTRPSIDVLFRSAAIAYGSRVVGVVLSGALSDGAAGLAAIRRCGGITVVQDPDDAQDGELPANALAAGAEHRVRTANLGTFVVDLSRSPRSPAVPVPLDLEVEGRAALAAMTDPAKLVEVGEQTKLTCPECQGPMRLLRGGGTDRYRCHVGHSYTSSALLGEQGLHLERALWVAYRTLLERARMLEGLVQEAASRGRPHVSAGYDRRLSETREHVEALRRTLASVEAPGAPDVLHQGEVSNDIQQR